MPIIEKDGSVYIKYEIPDEIKKLITYDFLKEFRNQLFRVHEYYSLDTFADFGIPTNTSTSGWYASLGKACLLTHNEKLWDYWRGLDWYDADIFDGELADMLVKNKLILDDSSKIIGKLLNINPDDIVCCSDCGKLYTKDMCVVISENSDEDYIEYKCLYCQDHENSKSKEFRSTDYYRDVLNELEEYKKNHSISKSEEITDEENNL